MNHWTRPRYQVNLPLYEGKGKVTASEEHLAIAREAAREGMVLLKNEGGLLPLTGGSRVALFGKGTFDYVKGGGGSGDVTCSFTIDLYEGLKQQPNAPEIYEPLCAFYRENVKKQLDEGALPGLTVEPAVPLQLLAGAREFTDTAVISICRFSGEGWDRMGREFEGQDEYGLEFLRLSQRLFPDSDFYLTPGEKELVEKVCADFPRVIVVLNIGGLMDFKWFSEDPRIGSALLAWQGGMMGGLAAADLLMGNASPCGRLPDTAARDLDDYPSTAGFHESPDYVDYTEDIYVGYRFFETIPGMKQKVIYPFGYGLSYTDFAVDLISAGEADDRITVTVSVRNCGRTAGKEVVQLYYSAQDGLLGKPSRELAAFAKTGLLAPDERQELELSFPVADMASYDDLGKIARSAYVLEKGEYRFYAGANVRDAVLLPYSFRQDSDRVTEQLISRAAPWQLEKRLRSDGTYETLPAGEPHDHMQNGLGWEGFSGDECLTPQTRFIDRMKFFEREKEFILDDVADEKCTLDEFIAQLSIDEKIHLLGGQPNTGVANTFGFGNLPEYGVPSVMTADGPAGLRIRPECGVYTTAFPCSTLLASTWDPAMVERVGFAAGEEVRENNISIWLTPAVCIHRSPLCGRNFEYYSEDPYLTGTLSAAMIRGIQRNTVAAAIKHFCCNNKETNRKNSDSRVSERALREIYLKGFEIAVKTAHPMSLMTAYNLVNGERASENRDLLEGILRGEWGYRGAVMTDWWNNGEQYKELNAGNDIKMGTGFPERVKLAYEKGLISEETITRSARRVLELILKLD